MAPTACRRMVSGTLSLFCLKCFSPFPHGTCTLSVSQEYLALPDGPGGFTQDSSCPALLRIPPGWEWLRVRDFHPLWCNFPDASTHHAQCLYGGPTTPAMRCHNAGLGSSPFARHYLGNHYLFSLPPGTKMFQFPGLALLLGKSDSPSD